MRVFNFSKKTAWRKGRDALRLAWEYSTTGRACRAQSSLFDKVETYCMFVGYPRSGHSIVGALLDAHPHAVIAHEASALQYVYAGFDRDRLYHALLRNSACHAAAQRRSGEYVYAVPEQWQGSYECLRIIGDKKGEGANLRLREAPHLLDRLRQTVSVPLRIVHVVRNPFDNIATMARRGAEKDGGTEPDLAAAAERYFRLCASARSVRERVEPEEWIEFRHEDFVAAPAETLAAVCRRIRLEPFADYLTACAGIVYASPHRSRDRVTWPSALRTEVERQASGFAFLHGYSFES